MSALVQTSPTIAATAFQGTASSTFATNPTAGNLIVVSGAVNGASPAISNAGFTLILGARNTGTSSICPFVAYGYAPGGALTITVTNGGDQCIIFDAVEVSGVVASSPLGQQGASSSLTSAPTATTGGSVGVGDYVVTSYAVQAGTGGVTTTTPPSGFTTDFNSNFSNGGGASAHQIAGSAGVVSAVWPYFSAGSDSNSALIVSFLASAGGPTSYYLSDIIEM